jgi:hypothetical protein
MNVTRAALPAWNRRQNWRSQCQKPMVVTVKLRLLRALVFVLVTAQVLMSPPVVAAMTAHAGDGARAEMPCADTMPQHDDGKPCPCCPDGTGGMAACLSACAASTGLIAQFSVAVTRACNASVPGVSPLPRAHFADPPLKPPPIANQPE